MVFEHLQSAMNEPSDSKQVAQKAIRGAVALGMRQVLVQGLNVLGGILLARMLSPAEFGLYAITIFFIAFLGAFGGTGLAAGLIRQQHQPDELDYKSVFTAQQVLVAFLVLILWLAAPTVAVAYRLPPDHAWLFRLVALSLLVTSFMVIPQVRLERRLAFDRLAFVEIMQAFTFNTVAVFLVWRGLGPLSFSIALLLRALVGAIMMNWLSPWNFGWRWDWQRIRTHLGFGIFLQGGQVVSLLKDSITPIFVGLYLGTGSVGHINWAQMVANYTVLALMVFQRLYMPVFARLQHDRVALIRFVERVLFATNTLVAPISVLTVVLIDPITRLVFGEKWLVALPIFYLLVLANLVVATSTPLQGLLNALGQSRTTFAFTLLWAAVTWIMGLPLIYWFGALGFALANVGVQITNFWLFAIVRKQLPIQIWKAALPSWITAFLVGAIIWFADRLIDVSNLYILVGLFALGLALFGALFMWRYKTEVRELYSAWKAE